MTNPFQFYVVVFLIVLTIIIMDHLEPPDGNKGPGWDLTSCA